MQPITVAIADENAARREKFEDALQGEQGIRVLTNTTTEGHMTTDRRQVSRDNISAIEDIVARVRRLNPRILLADLEQCAEADCAMLTSLRAECPETLVVLLSDESLQKEEQLMHALASGARGYLNPATDQIHLSKVVQAIDRGEAWVPRKMLGKIMERVLH